MSKTKTIRVLLVLGVLILGALITFVPRTKVYADYSAPSWWNGDTCDSTHFNAGSGQTATLLATWNGLEACGYGPYQIIPGSNPPTHGVEVAVTFPGGHGEFEWDCTELVKRYLYLAYGANAISANGDQIVDAYTNSNGFTQGYPNLFRKVTNDGNTHVKVGDVLSYSTVHTAIVTNTDDMNAKNGTGTITILEQNASLTGVSTQSVTNWKIKHGVDDGGTTDTVAAWLTPRGQFSVQTTASPATQSQFRGVSAYSSSNVWAVGFDNYAQNVLIEHWNGTSWTQQTGANPGTTYNVLYGVKALSATNIWAVGYYNDSTGLHTLIEHSTNGGSTWSKNTSYQGVGYLYAIDGNPSTGDAWAVGTVNGNNPLVLHLSSGSWSKVNTSADTVNQALLYGVSEDSSGHVWVVGDYNNSGDTTFTMYYNGTWTNKPSPNPGTTGNQLKGVVTLSSTNAWAVGYEDSNIGFLTHWNGSAWSSATTLSLGSASNFFGIAAADANDIFAVGTYYDSGVTFPLVWHTSNGGSTWAQLLTDGSLNYGGSGEFFGIAIEPTNYNTWTAGDGDSGSLAEFLN